MISCDPDNDNEPVILESVLTINPFVSDIDAVAVPSAIWDKLSPIIPEAGIFVNPEPLPSYEPLNDPENIVLVSWVVNLVLMLEEALVPSNTFVSPLPSPIYDPENDPENIPFPESATSALLAWEEDTSFVISTDAETANKAWLAVIAVLAKLAEVAKLDDVALSTLGIP